MSELYVYMLPYQIVEKIWFYLDDTCKIFTCREYYEKFHCLLKDNNIINKYDSYIRSMIRDDYSFVFNYIVSENLNYWLTKNKFYYQNVVYYSYIHYILDIVREYSSQKCKQILWNYLNTCGYSKNIHKNKRNKFNKWRN